MSGSLPGGPLETGGVDPGALGFEIARVLADAIAAARSPLATASAWSVARDSAQLLSLDGLVRALAVLEVHAGRELPVEVVPVAERLDRYVARCRETGDLGELRAHDAELRAMADEVGGLEWSDEGARSAVATLGVAEALGDVTIADDNGRAVARRTRVAVPVAAALRAALDWLLPEHGSAAPIGVTAEPSALQIRLERVGFSRLGAVDRVVAAAGGNLGPAPQAIAMGAPWILRLPAVASRSTYLMVERSDVRMAIPWHAVLGLRMAPAEGAVSTEQPLEHDVIDASTGTSRPGHEHPVVLIAHGLKRGYLPVDRLIWRLAASPCDTTDEAPPGSSESVATDDGDVYWVASLEQLLESVETPVHEAHPVFDAAPREPMLTGAHVIPLAWPTPEAPAPAAAQAAPAAAPAHDAAPSGSAPTDVTAEPVAAPRASEVLVAEDSIAARLFLVRLLEQQGLVVASVSTSAQLLRRLGERPWALVLTDIELPDAYGVDWLRGVREAAATLAEPPRVVALVRDRADIDVARAADIHETLLKPFGREALVALLARAGLPARP